MSRGGRASTAYGFLACLRARSRRCGCSAWCVDVQCGAPHAITRPADEPRHGAAPVVAHPALSCDHGRDVLAPRLPPDGRRRCSRGRAIAAQRASHPALSAAAVRDMSTSRDLAPSCARSTLVVASTRASTCLRLFGCEPASSASCIARRGIGDRPRCPWRTSEAVPTIAPRSRCAGRVASIASPFRRVLYQPRVTAMRRVRLGPEPIFATIAHVLEVYNLVEPVNSSRPLFRCGAAPSTAPRRRRRTAVEQMSL